MNNRFKVLGINDDESFCDCCGKQNLKCVVWIEDSETGAVKHFGVVCADKPSKCFGLSAEIKTAKAQFMAKLRFAYRVAARLYKQAGGKYVNGSEPYTLDVADMPLYQNCLAKAKSIP